MNDTKRMFQTMNGFNNIKSPSIRMNSVISRYTPVSINTNLVKIKLRNKDDYSPEP